jgi:hypothetical protein
MHGYTVFQLATLMVVPSMYGDGCQPAGPEAPDDARGAMETQNLAVSRPLLARSDGIFLRKKKGTARNLLSQH